MSINELSIAVITSSPVQGERLPALWSSWLARAQERCGGVVVVSDIAVKCTRMTSMCIPTVKCACEASHWGLPCKTACAFEESFRNAPLAKWHIRVMDDTVVDIDALAWHLDKLDPSSPWYVGEHIDIKENFSAALGGAGWALSQAATRLALDHMPLYHELSYNLGCNFSDGGLYRLCGEQEWPLPQTHLGRLISDTPRGLKLMSPFADDIFWAAYMSALDITATGPHGFTQAPIDVFGGVPLCDPFINDDNRAAADNTRRLHDLGVYYSQSAGGVVGRALARGTSRQKPRHRPAVIHMGDEVGTIPSKHWRQQINYVFETLTASNATVAIYESKFHYWRICVSDQKHIRPPIQLSLDDSVVELKLSIDGTDSKILTVRACDQPEILVNQFCRNNVECQQKVYHLVLQALDVARGHPRPATLSVQLADGTQSQIVLQNYENPTQVAQVKCQLWNLSDVDCAHLIESLVELHPHFQFCQSSSSIS